MSRKTAAATTNAWPDPSLAAGPASEPERAPLRGALRASEAPFDRRSHIASGDASEHRHTSRTAAGRGDRALGAAVVVVCALLLVLPAAVDPWGRLAFEPLKASVLRAAAVVAVALWLWGRRSGAHGRLDTGVGRAALLVLALSGASSVVSLAPAVSAGGSFDRGMGWLTLAACALVLLVVSDLARRNSYRERMVSALVMGSFVPCAYFLVQRVGLDPLAWTTLGPPGSTLASPTFLAGYLVLVAPFAAYKTARAAGRGAVAYGGWLALLLLICAVILLTTIRGPLLGLLAAAVTFGVLARPRGVRQRDLWLGACGAGIGVAGSVLAIGGTTLHRFLAIAQGTDSSVERLTLWRDAVAILSSDLGRSVVGFGPETASIVLERAPNAVRITQNQQWDRAHNLVLDTWLAAGLLGVLSLGALLMCAAWALRRAPAAGGASRVLRAAVGAAIVGHLVEASFAFETVVTGSVFWIVLGLAASCGPARGAGSSAAGSAWVGSSPAGWARLSAVVGAGALVCAPVLVTPAIADALYGAARRTDYLRGAQLEDVAAAWAPWIEELPRAAGLDWQQVANRRRDEEAATLARQDMQRAADRGVGQPTAFLRLARLDLAANRLDAAEADCLQALAWGPYRVAIWEICGDVAAAAGDPTLAAARASTAASLR